MSHQIEGRFYPLQHNEWLRACQELTPSERDVLYYLRTLDPYSNGVNVSASSIAKALSTPKKSVHRSTVGRALKVLDAKGFIDMELLSVRVVVTAKGVLCQHNNVAPAQQERSPRNKSDRHATSTIATQQVAPETLSELEFDISKTYKTYKDLSQKDTREFFDLQESVRTVEQNSEALNKQPIFKDRQLTAQDPDKDPIQVPPRSDDEFLNFVLKTEVLTLPHPPATEAQQRRLARRLIDRDREVGDLSRAFEKWQQRQTEIASRWSEVGSVRPEVSLPKTRTLGSELAKLQAFFESGYLANNAATKAMRDTAIARALKLGFVVTDAGIALAPGQIPEQEVSSCANG